MSYHLINWKNHQYENHQYDIIIQNIVSLYYVDMSHFENRVQYKEK